MSFRARWLMVLAVVVSLGVYVAGDLAGRHHGFLALLALPVVLGAIAYGARGGVAVGLLASMLGAVWWAQHGEPGGYGAAVVRVVTCLLIGVLLGRFVDSREGLRERTARHDSLSLDLVATTSDDGVFLDVNPAFTRVLGYAPAEIVGKSFLAFVHPDDRDRTLALIAAQNETDQSISGFSNRYRCRDGSYRWLDWASHAIPRSRELLAVGRDITERKALEEVDHQHTHLLEQAVLARTEELRRRNEDLDEARRETLHRLALAAEYRDDDTQQHARRIGNSAAMLAQALGLSARAVEVLRDAAPLHDVGKIAVSDSVLLKPGPLTKAEFDYIKQHTGKGSEILSGSHSIVLQTAEEIALSHHEWWDGSGYPRGLSGRQIPLNARIVAVADVYDALTHKRPYKTAWHIREAVREMHRLSGTQFDPDIIVAFKTLDPAKLAQALPAADTPTQPPDTAPTRRRHAEGDETRATDPPSEVRPSVAKQTQVSAAREPTSLRRLSGCPRSS